MVEKARPRIPADGWPLRPDSLVMAPAEEGRFRLGLHSGQGTRRGTRRRDEDVPKRWLGTVNPAKETTSLATVPDALPLPSAFDSVQHRTSIVYQRKRLTVDREGLAVVGVRAGLGRVELSRCAWDRKKV